MGCFTWPVCWCWGWCKKGVRVASLRLLGMSCYKMLQRKAFLGMVVVLLCLTDVLHLFQYNKSTTLIFPKSKNF